MAFVSAHAADHLINTPFVCGLSWFAAGVLFLFRFVALLTGAVIVPAQSFLGATDEDEAAG